MITPARPAFFWIAATFLLFALVARGADRLPSPPARHFNDYANVIPRATASQLDRQLEQFERDTSNQLVVAVFPRMESASSVEDYTFRVAESWKAGRENRDNGAVLFVFLEERQLYIQVGYGLEPVLTDATASSIIREVITPHFRTGDYGGGLVAGVEAMMAATRGEYRGTGGTVAGQRGGAQGRPSVFPILVFMTIMLVFGALSRRSQRRMMGSRRGRFNRRDDWFGPGAGGIGGFGGFGGGGGSSGGVSGGGGGFGGGGAGGRW